MYPPPEDYYPPRSHRYTLEDSPGYPGRKFDVVLGQIVATIQHLCIDNMVFAAANIRVWNLTNSPSIWPPTARVPVKFYVFKPCHEEFPIAVPVKIADLSAPITGDNLMVRVDGEWKPLTPWLLSLPDPDQILKDRPDSSIWAQRQWWKRNGKTFPLMKLPVEVRMNIYKHVLGGKIYLSTADSRHGGDQIVTLWSHDSWDGMPTPPHAGYYGPLPARSSNWWMDLDAFAPSRPSYSILWVSKEVHDEATGVVWSGTWKCFLSPSLFHDVLQARLPNRYTWLTRIELDFGFCQYFDFFGVTIFPSLSKTESEYEGLLLSMRYENLRDVRLRFRCADLDNPWYEFKVTHHSEDWFVDDENYSHMEYDLCQSTLVDCLMHFALPVLSKFPRVRLVGWIDPRVKEKWEYILSREYDPFRASIYDWQKEGRELVGLPAYRLPPCR
ncbi:uncharacterized protein EI97DRAFT_442141 [Westerdykella ornata]|uniref:Uncharacterized protein n=1 Tax=Westerdykella ornata TaxID=318751 RepID=A0A6A6JJK9_WESOR|nr:uncharacterized protein EI97DRAFT_442141 [Westerdykella ornata]KAF2276771.1 hypothetical protein EI97DRAFT_442141 [Westerdykella ornata]